MCSTYIVIITMEQQKLLYLKQSSDDKQAAALLCSGSLQVQLLCVYNSNTETKA